MMESLGNTGSAWGARQDSGIPVQRRSNSRCIWPRIQPLSSHQTPGLFPISHTASSKPIYLTSSHRLNIATIVQRRRLSGILQLLEPGNSVFHIYLPCDMELKYAAMHSLRERSQRPSQ